MKSLLFNRRPSEPLTLPPDMTMAPDSAITHPGMPLFLADTAWTWHLEVIPVFRVSRLGKGISRRFASRHIDAVAVALRAIPEEVAPKLSTLFDCALTLGQFLPVDIAGASPLSLEVSTARSRVGATLSPPEMATPECIEAASRYIILRSGDLIAPVGTGLRVKVSPGDKAEASLRIGSEESNLVLKIK